MIPYRTPKTTQFQMKHKISIRMKNEELIMAKNAGIQFPTVLPLFRNPPNKLALEAWIQAHKSFPELLDIVKLMVKHLNYISFERFFSSLEAVIQHFVKEIQGRPYLLWIPSKEGGSDRWVASLALEYGKLPWPMAICDSSQINDFLQQHPEVHDVLLLDDASYSGSHLSTELHHLKNNTQQVCIFIGIPFLTSYVPSMILKKHKHHEYRFLEFQKMPMIREILSLKEIALLKRFQISYQTETLTYFDHTYPDYWSTIANFNNGMHLLRPMSCEIMRSQGFLAPWDSANAASLKPMSAEDWDNAIEKLFPDTDPRPTPIIIQPYKLIAKKEHLIEALAAKTIGERTPYPLPQPLAGILKANGINIAEPTKLAYVESRTNHSSDSSMFSFFDQPLAATESDEIEATASAASRS